MRADLCSIPVREVFEPKDGCPVCRMRDMLEERILEYIMGAAMMEPDVRKMTNEKGFCYDHFCKMLSRRNRLSVALMLDSHLKELDGKMFGALTTPASRASKVEKLTGHCFVCESIESSMSAIIGNTLHLYEQDREFRKLFGEQPVLCLPHYAQLSAAAERQLSRRYRAEFQKTAAEIARRTLTELSADVKHFCDMYDYRNNNEEADWGNSRDSLERAVGYLTSWQVD